MSFSIKYNILSLLLVFLTSSVFAQKQYEYFESDTLNYVFFPKGEGMYIPVSWVFGREAKKDTSFHIKQTNFTKDDYTQTNLILKQQLDTCSFNADINYAAFKKYLQQYGAYNTSKGARVAYINCVCSKSMFANTWKTQMADALDGGKCFYHIAVDLTNKKIISIWYNTSG